ncbi:hypothetical protein [Methanocalculus sp.]|nr:hypothetical protein [Methanocalculus sp.]MDG6250576.1 hypothetical protein [Methanocalculus sp.]
MAGEIRVAGRRVSGFGQESGREWVGKERRRRKIGRGEIRE